MEGVWVVVCVDSHFGQQLRRVWAKGVDAGLEEGRGLRSAAGERQREA
jgi:hypothetical protein